ncbi:hypothetical protein RHSIM_Rhsim03G0043000 [Rhododendron simsii]|uniref:Pentatricopeptide repeat-containing protein n=1 Tax=Rhododendron simsii TaxID=118357 RepID=A0A834LQN7_RHOSS|nr:hypothetical protein RHSIM_Rhsim03G0043000 [Rhododendron simsii]
MGKLWQKMVDENDSSVNNAAFANIIESLCHERLFQDVFMIAEDTPQGKSVPEEFAYGQMIDSLCKVGRHNGAARVAYIMKTKGIIPSFISYNSIVHGLCKEGSCMRAYQLLEEGIEFGYWPSEYTYIVLIEGLCLEADLRKAKEVFQIMLKKEGLDRTRIYNNYFKSSLSYEQVNNPTELLNVLVFMLQSQCKPDVITLNTIISGFCRMGRIEEALRIMNDMLMGKFNSPDAVTLTTICGMLNVGRIREALDLLYKVMPEKGVRPGLIMQFFVDYLNYSEKVKQWSHDDFVYAAILKGLCRSGKFNEACNFLYELVDCGVSPNIVNYNILIDIACKSGLKAEAYQIVGEMRKNGLTPDAVTWRILDRLHGNAGKQVCISANTQFEEGLQEFHC